MAKPIAFVIMPFALEHRGIYDAVIKPTFEENLGWSCWRVDERLGGGNIMRQIVEGIAGATLVVADLTALRPNVLYELGLAHALGMPVLTLFRKGSDEMPFDLRSYRYVEYEDTAAGADKLSRAIVNAVRALPEWGVRPNNPAQDFLPAERRGGAPIRAAPLPAASADEEILREIGYLKELTSTVRQRLHYVQVRQVEAPNPSLDVEAAGLEQRLRELRQQLEQLATQR